MRQHGLLLSGVHLVSVAAGIASIRGLGEIRVGQAGVRLVAEFRDPAQLELHALVEPRAVGGPPAQLAEQVELVKAGGASSIERLESPATGLKCFDHPPDAAGAIAHMNVQPARTE